VKTSRGFCPVAVPLTCSDAGCGAARSDYRTATSVTFANGQTLSSCASPSGTSARTAAGYEVAVPVGRDPITKRYSYSYASAPTFEEAEAVRDKMLADLTKGRQPRDDATVESGAAEVP